MQENHLKPNEEGYPNNHQDLLNASLIFAKALGLMFEENQGIVVNVTGDIKLENVSKVVVFLKDEKIHISECEHDLEEGTIVGVDGQVKEGDVTP